MYIIYSIQTDVQTLHLSETTFGVRAGVKGAQSHAHTHARTHTNERSLRVLTSVIFVFLIKPETLCKHRGVPKHTRRTSSFKPVTECVCIRYTETCSVRTRSSVRLSSYIIRVHCDCRPSPGALLLRRRSEKRARIVADRLRFAADRAFHTRPFRVTTDGRRGVGGGGGFGGAKEPSKKKKTRDENDFLGRTSHHICARISQTGLRRALIVRVQRFSSVIKPTKDCRRKCYEQHAVGGKRVFGG